MLAVLHPARKSGKGQAVETNLLNITATSLGIEIENEMRDFSLSDFYFGFACVHVARLKASQADFDFMVMQCTGVRRQSVKIRQCTLQNTEPL